MTVTIEERDGIHVVKLSGELTGGHEGDFVEAVTNLFSGPRTQVLIDLADVPFMNSTGLSELVRVAAQANIQEGRIILANLSPFVAGVMQTTQLERFFEICPTVEDALAKLR